MTSERRRKSSRKNTQKNTRWGFGFVILLMAVVSVFLMALADSRFSGLAWGHLKEDRELALEQDGEDNISLDGFIVVDLSDADDSGAGQITDSITHDYKYTTDNSGSAYAAQSPSERVAIDSSASSLPPVGYLSSDAAIAELASLPLFSFPEEAGIGPMPKNFSDFESIVLDTKNDGTRMPEDSEASDDMDDGIILSEVGATWKEHVVKSGETLSDIALQYGGVTTQDILRANGLKDANRLAEQQILLVPNSEQDIEDTLEEVRTRQTRILALREHVDPLSVKSYTVAQGDNLWSIANAQNLEVDTLVGSNTFKNSVLQPGNVLRIPNQDGIFYSIKKGDTIESIAKRYGVSMDKIRKVNVSVNLASIKAGGEIFLPGARPEAIAEAQEKPSGSKANQSVASNSKKTDKSSSGAKDTQKSSRNYRWPVMGRINSPFGWRRHPVTHRRDFHTGLDIKASRGTVIRGSREGKVVYAGWMGGYGKVVVVDHSGGQSTLYAHCSSLLVRQGEKVSVGQNIARVGTTGRTTGPHLHFEVRTGNSPVNPLKYLK
ncbi:peptidase M23 [Synergistales bacterium]|nr:peptidase M23 [Synergistales bacterium]